jgi:hypothetical protein
MRLVVKTCGPSRQPVGAGSMTARFRTLSQTPQAVRSAGGRRWERVLPASAPANRTLQADKSDAFRLTVRVHGLRNISSTAATRAVVRNHSSPPSGLRALSTTRARNLPEIVLRYESRTSLRAELAPHCDVSADQRQTSTPLQFTRVVDCKSARRRGGRVAECGGLLNRCTG